MAGRDAGYEWMPHPIGVPIDPGPPPPVLLKPWPSRAAPQPPRIAALFEHYRTRSVRDAIVPVLRHADALWFLDDCERLGLEVLGMDFFCLEHGGLRVCHYVSFTATGPADPRDGIARPRAIVADGLPEGAHAVEIGEPVPYRFQADSGEGSGPL